jgi:hypothetical protein
VDGKSMGIYNTDFICKLRKQLALEGFSIRRNKRSSESDYIVYSPEKYEYYVSFPEEEFYEVIGFNSGAPPYRRACDVNMIKTHIKHCRSITIREENLTNNDC